VKKLLLPLAVLVAGLGAGGGAAVAARHVLGPPAPRAPKVEPKAFVAAEKIVAPLVLPDGRLAGYVGFDAALEVSASAEARVTAELPLLLNAINMRTYRTPLASGPDGSLPDIRVLRRVVMESAAEGLGRGTVSRVAITRAEPA